ncbi:uncharacterized protein LOC113211877 isoform X2 [Frankliniella occidentalis]|uniref:Uncharacterized protein LOC113211877 isoform X2 n=1 Tax=Frankliniella occidentalis TaxID=133901 RepID=A0A6J1SY63_FRAOC|nr:uncharacterized protein LOC113211877 isoform X2 [Frankliniella occidentalis]
MTCEFTNAMWGVTIGSAFCVAVVLFSLTRRSDICLQVLAPLVSQSFPERQSSPHRIVYGSWLLVSVVISSAYQGQLRTQLSVGKMKGEIDTLEELAESNLSILMGIELRPSASSLLPARMLPRVEYVNEFEQLLPMLHYVAEQRNVALIIFDDFDPWILTLFRRSRLLHHFILPISNLKSNIMVTRGSPLEKPLRRMVGLLHASGVMYFWHDREKRNARRQLCGKEELMFLDTGRTHSPLRWIHVKPAFIILYGGLAIASMWFAIECVLFKRRNVYSYIIQKLIS